MQNLPLKISAYLILPRSESALKSPVAGGPGAEVIRVETKLRPESFKMTNNPATLLSAKYRIGYFASSITASKVSPST